MADVSDAFEEAVRCRATGVGLVPIEVIRKLTRSEWGRIRMMGQGEAGRLIAVIRRRARDINNTVSLGISIREQDDVG